MKAKDLIQEVHFKASPKQLYDCIIQEDLHEQFTESEAQIDPNLNGEFSCYGGYITGKNIFLEEGLMIIQEWRAEEENWHPDHFSTVQFKFEAADGGCKLTFLQKEIPEEYYESISTGWYEYYWEPLQRFLSQN